MRKNIIIDTDAGADDLLALAMAFASPELEIKAVIASYGNFPLEESLERVHAFLERLEVQNPPPILRGSKRPLRRSYVPHYSIHGRVFLSKRRRRKSVLGLLSGSKQPTLFSQLEGFDDCVYVCLGPLTTFATLFTSQPRPRFRQLLVVGGAFFSPGNATPVAEANFYWDPEAVEKMFRLRQTPFIFPLRVTERVQISMEQIGKLRHSALLQEVFAPYAHYYLQDKRAWFDPQDMRRKRYRGGSLHDVLAIAALVDRSIFTFRRLRLSLRYLGQNRGMVVPLLRNEHKVQKSDGSVVANVAWSVNIKRFWRLFHTILST